MKAFLTPREQLAELRKSVDERRSDRSAEDKWFAERLTATGHGRFKLELIISQGRSNSRPYPGMLQFFESGAALGGGGDVRVYLCPGKERLGNGCSAFIPSANHQYEKAMCTSCGNVWSSEQTWGEVFGRHGPDGWGQLLEIYFERFNRDADVYLKYTEEDYRGVAELEQKYTGTQGDIQRAAELKMSVVQFPLKYIIESSQHSSVLSRFKSLMRA